MEWYIKWPPNQSANLLSGWLGDRQTASLNWLHCFPLLRNEALRALWGHVQKFRLIPLRKSSCSGSYIGAVPTKRNFPSVWFQNFNLKSLHLARPPRWRHFCVSLRPLICPWLTTRLGKDEWGIQTGRRNPDKCTQQCGFEQMSYEIAHMRRGLQKWSWNFPWADT